MESAGQLLLLAAGARSRTAPTPRWGLQAQYPQSAGSAAVQPVEDRLRQARRDALVAYLLGPGPVDLAGRPVPDHRRHLRVLLDRPRDVRLRPYNPALAALAGDSAIRPAVLLNLTIGATVDMTRHPLEEWSWRQQYRLWQANREVFLYPENYVLPEMRTNASSFFTDLENDLRQTNCDADAAEAAFENYLRKLVEVSRLVVAAHTTRSTRTDRTVSACVRPHPRHAVAMVLPNATPAARRARRLERLGIAQSRHRLGSAGAGHLGSAAALIWPVFKAGEPRNSRIRPCRLRAVISAADRAEILGGRVCDERVQRRPMAAEADHCREDVLYRTGAGIGRSPPQAFTIQGIPGPVVQLADPGLLQSAESHRLACGGTCGRRIPVPECAAVRYEVEAGTLSMPPALIDRARSRRYALGSTPPSLAGAGAPRN